jgi:hypothetical protein
MTGRKPKEKPKTGLEDGAAVFRLELGERIRYLLDMFDSRPDAAAIAGVTPEHLASYIGGRAKPPFELIGRLAQAKGISLEWLATGEGHSRLGEAEGGYASIRVVERDSHSGPGAYPMADDVRDRIAFSRAWLQAAVRVPEDRLCAVFNRGDENAPEINDGDVMLVETGLERVVDGFHILTLDGRLLTKSVKLYLDGRVALATVKTEAKPEFSTPEKAADMLFGRVRWRGGIV